jgi:hypothetical protein
VVPDEQHRALLGDLLQSPHLGPEVQRGGQPHQRELAPDEFLVAGREVRRGPRHQGLGGLLVGSFGRIGHDWAGWGVLP